MSRPNNSHTFNYGFYEFQYPSRRSLFLKSLPKIAATLVIIGVASWSAIEFGSVPADLVYILAGAVGAAGTFYNVKDVLIRSPIIPNSEGDDMQYDRSRNRSRSRTTPENTGYANEFQEYSFPDHSQVPNTSVTLPRYDEMSNEEIMDAIITRSVENKKPYEILGSSNSNLSLEEAKKMWQNLSRKVHPDKNIDLEEKANDASKELNNAFSKIKRELESRSIV